MKVLILNHQHVACGVYQFAKRIYSIVSNSTNVEYFHVSVSNRQQYLNVVAALEPNCIVYNWHWDRMPWLLDSDVKDNKTIKHHFIYHDGSMFSSYDKYLFFGALDPDKTACSVEKRVVLPRPLFNYTGLYPKNPVPTIGSFGFGFSHKNFHLIVKDVNALFDSAVINLHMTHAYFGDLPGHKLSDIVDLCKANNIKSGIKLNITTNFLSDEDLLEFLAKNDVNVFSYQKELTNPGLSSAIDYALSVRRPIAITDNMMFRHIVNNKILLEKNNIKQIISHGTAPLEKYYKAWSEEALTKAFDELFLGGV